MDKDTMAKKVNGQWLVPIFAGMIDTTEKWEGRDQAFKRQKIVDDCVQQEAAMELAEEGSQAMESRHHEFVAASASGVIEGSGVELDLPDDLIRNPQEFLVRPDEYSSDIRRECILGMKRQAVISEREEQDEHEALQAARVEKVAKASKGVGRPKKLKSQLLAEASRIVRDRAQQIQDSHDIIVSQVQKEATQSFTTLPDDLKQAMDAMTKDVGVAAATMLEVKKAVENTDIAPSTSDEGDFDTAALKKQVHDASKPVFKDHQSAGNKAMAAFRGTPGLWTERCPPPPPPSTPSLPAAQFAAMSPAWDVG